jgi:hypothetical protein
MREFEPDWLAELTKYIVHRSARDSAFGKVKLVKLIAYSDFTAYQELGESITGAIYCKLEHGPAPRALPATLDALIAGGYLDAVTVPAGPYKQVRYVALKEPDTDVFAASELAVIDAILARFSNFGGKAISIASHRDFAGWELVEEYDEIPYRTALISKDEPSPTAVAAGRAALARL